MEWNSGISNSDQILKDSNYDYVFFKVQISHTFQSQILNVNKQFYLSTNCSFKINNPWEYNGYHDYFL